MKKLKRTHSEAFLQKMRSVFIFNEFYTKNSCLIGEGILEPCDKSNKKFALIRIFIDLSSNKDQPYVIFIKKMSGLIFLDLVSTAKTTEEIAKKHEAISSNHLIFAFGSLSIKNEIVILEKEKESDNFGAALLWAADFKSNLDPKNGLEKVYELLIPGS